MLAGTSLEQMIRDLLLTFPPLVTSSHHRHADRRHHRSLKLARHLVVATLLIGIFTLPARGEFPADRQPLNVISSQESGKYSVFIGSNASNPENHLLHDLSGIKKINSTFYVHSRNYIFVLNNSKSLIGDETGKLFYHKQAIFWNVTVEQNLICHGVIGRTDCQCQNFVTMMEQMRGDVSNKLTNQIVACGSHGYSPKTKLFAMEKDGKLTDISGERDSRTYTYYCSAVADVKTPSLVNDGNLYVGIARSDSTFIARMGEWSKQAGLRTSEEETRRGSDFVRIVEGSKGSGKILVFFNEYAQEDFDQRKLARVGQICRNDDLLSPTRHFTSFFKSRLNCSLPGFPPHYFDLVHATSDVVHIRSAAGGSERVVFAVMRTPSNGIVTSAICVYSLDEMEASLASSSMAPYKGVWVESDEAADYPDISSCNSYVAHGRRKLNDSQIAFALTNSLVSDVVQTWDVFSLDSPDDCKPASGALFTSKDDVLTTILVDDDIPPKTSSSDRQRLTHVTMLIGTESGDVIKVLVVTSSGSLVVVERRQVYDDKLCGDGDKSVRSLEFDKKYGNLLVTYSSCVVMVPLCHPSPAALHCETNCKKSRDPYCQWDGSKCGSTYPNDLTRDQDLEGKERLPECNEGKTVVPVLPVSEKPDGDKAENVTGGAVVGGDATGDKQVEVLAAGGDASTLYILVAFIGFFVGIIITSFIFCCCNPCHEIKKKRHNLINGEATKSAVSRTNSNRHDSAEISSSVAGNPPQRVKHPSESSTKSHIINNRISYYDDVIVDGVTSAQRRRHVTEMSGGASSGEGRSRNNSTAKTPTEGGGNPRDFEGADDKRKSRKLSSTSKSSTTARNLQSVNKMSTSSNPREEVGTLNKNMLSATGGADGMGGDVFMRQASTESGHGSDHRSIPQQQSVNPGGQHGDLRRSYSVQQPNAHSIHRTASFGPGVPPKGRQIGRQHSFQVTSSHPHNDLHFTATTPMMMVPPPGPHRDKWMPKTPMAPPPSMMVPLSQSAKGMTYSLDRRKMKAFPSQNSDFQIPKLASSAPQNAGDPQQQQHQQQQAPLMMTPQQHPQRQRYVSESMTPMHPAVHQKVNMLDYAIIEDPANPPQNPANPYPTGNRSRRDQLRLDLRGPAVDPSMGTRRRMMVQQQQQQQPSPVGTPIHSSMMSQGFRKPSLPPQQLPSPMDRRSFNFPNPSHRQRTPVGTPMDEDAPLLGEEAPVRKFPMKDLRTPSNPDINGTMRHGSESITPSIPESDGESVNSIDDETEYMETVA